MILATALTIMLQWGSDTIEPDAWWLYLGTTQGAKDIYDSGRRATPSVAVPVPLGTEVLWIRLYYRHRNAWPYVDFLYRTGSDLLGRGPDGIYLILSR